MSYALYYVYLVATYKAKISSCSNAWNTANCTLAYNYSCLPNITLPFINMTNVTTTMAPTTQATTIMTSTLMANMSNITQMTTPVSPLMTCPQYHSLQSNLPEAEFFR